MGSLPNSYDLATRALRHDSPEALASGLLAMLNEREKEWLEDLRDLLAALAPLHDCARRLGLDPVAVFDAAADAGPASLAQEVRDFGRRTDVTAASFAFTVADTSDGPEYRYVP